MKRKGIHALLLALLVIGLSVGMAFAAESQNFAIRLNSLSGGSIAKSESFILVNSVGGPVQINSSSASFRLCSGFVCGDDVTPVIKLFLPAVDGEE